MKTMYWDTFASEYCIEKDQYAPPERYVEVHEGVVEDNVFEKWSVDHDGKERIGIAFPWKRYRDPREQWRIRDSVAAEHNVRLFELLYMTLPKSIFNQYYDTAKSEEEEDQEDE